MSSPTPTLADQALIQCLAEALIEQARRVGLIVTIERESVPPLAMGNTVPVVRVWPDKDHRP